LRDRAKHSTQTLRVGRFRGEREIWDQHESAYIRLICGNHKQSHEERGYGADVEALAVHGARTERLYGRKLALTERSCLGPFASATQEGDLLAINCGTHSLFLLYKFDESHRYRIFGEAYVESKTGGLFGRGNDGVYLGSKDWVEWVLAAT